jgi:hypothetical protein
LEITLPLAFISILVAIKSSSNDLTADVVEATLSDVAMTPLTFTDYVTAMRAQRVCLLAETDDVGNDASFNISGIMDQGFNWQVPLVKCDSRLCTEHNQDATTFCEYGMIAVAGNNEGGRIRADAFKSWVETTYPAIVADGVMPFDFDLVQIFDSPDAMNRYVRATDYGVAGMPKIAMGIVWDGDSETNYTYQLRPNSTNFNAPESESRRGTQTTPSTGVSVDNFARDDESVCEPLAGSPSQGPLENSCTGQYLYNGVLTFQRLVHDFIFEESGAAEAGTTVAEAGVQFASFPIRSFRSSSFYDTIEGIPRVVLASFVALELRR